MKLKKFHIPYIDELLVTWHDVPGTHFIQKVNHFDIAILLLSSHVVHIDKTEHWFEKHFLTKFYTKLLDADTAINALQFVGLNLTNNLNVFRLCKELHEISTEKVRLQLLFYFFDLTVSDGDLHNDELKFMEALKQGFGIKEDAYQAVFSLYGMYNKVFRKKHFQANNSKLHTAYAIFGLPINAPFSEVKQKYKSLVKLHHPDKVTHLGKLHYEKATRMLQQINDAYSYIEDFLDNKNSK